MAVSDKPWNPSTADYASAEAYCGACAINQNGGAPATWSKGSCNLPYKEPDGTINRNGVHAAASVLAGGRGGVDAPLADRRAAARKLAAIYRNDLKETPPDSLVQLAGE